MAVLFLRPRQQRGYPQDCAAHRPGGSDQAQCDHGAKCGPKRLKVVGWSLGFPELGQCRHKPNDHRDVPDDEQAEEYAPDHPARSLPLKCGQWLLLGGCLLGLRGVWAALQAWFCFQFSDPQNWAVE